MMYWRRWRCLSCHGPGRRTRGALARHGCGAARVSESKVSGGYGGRGQRVFCNGLLGEEEDAKFLCCWKVTNGGRSRTFVLLTGGTRVTSEVEMRNR